MLGTAAARTYVGERVDTRTRGFLKTKNVLEHGVVQDWDAMEALLEQGFYQGLGKAPKATSLLITEHHLNPTRNTCADTLPFIRSLSFS